MSAYYVFLERLAALFKGLILVALLGGVYGFILIGKISSLRDSVYKRQFMPHTLSLIQVVYGVSLTMLMVARLPVALN